MHRRRVAYIAIMMTALAAPAPVPSAESVARSRIESAVTLEQAGRYGEAVEQLSQAIAAKALSRTDTARALFDRGVAYDGLGNMRAAEADYSAALRLDPLLAPALNNRADVLRRAGRFDAARRDYAAALKCPDVAREYAFYGLGLIALQQNNAEAARDYFQKALAANPGFMPAAEKLAPLLPAKTEIGLRASLGARSVTTPAVIDMPVPAGSKPVLVQLGAYQSEASAHVAWDKISAASADALRGLTPAAVPVDRAGTRLWRLRTTVPSRRAAEALCSALAQRQLVCVTVRR